MSAASAGAWLRWSWSPRDRHPAVTALGLAAVAVAVAMAVFGLPPVDLHGPLHYAGIMSPLCGGTRAAFYTARGDFALAWQYNPLGVLVVLGAAASALRVGAGLLARRWLTWTLTWTRRRVRLAAAAVTVLVIALEVRQQLRAELLMAGA